MEQRSVNALWEHGLTWEEMSTLAVCLALDLLEYLIPVMMAPLYGDVIDLVGLAFVLIFFSWYGMISVLELIPGFDILPLYTITWLTWYLQSGSVRKKRIQEELDAWR